LILSLFVKSDFIKLRLPVILIVLHLILNCLLIDLKQVLFKFILSHLCNLIRSKSAFNVFIFLFFIQFLPFVFSDCHCILVQFVFLLLLLVGSLHTT